MPITDTELSRATSLVAFVRGGGVVSLPAAIVADNVEALLAEVERLRDGLERANMDLTMLRDIHHESHYHAGHRDTYSCTQGLCPNFRKAIVRAARALDGLGSD